MDPSHHTRTSDPRNDEKKDLYQALVEGNIRLVEEILQKHPYLINCELKGDGFSASPLVIACDNMGHKTAYDTIDLLLKHGADPNCVGYFGKRRLGFDRMPPLMLLAWKAGPKSTELLLNGGANVNQTNSKGQTTLHLCCSVTYDRNEIMKILLSYNADVSVKDVYGRTALHYACEKTSNGVVAVDLLLRAGAELNIADGSSFTELQLAAQSDCNSRSKVQLLLDSYPYPIETIIEAYETLAWSLLQDIEFRDDSECLLDPVVDCMRKATLLRQEHGIPKNVSCPLECYDFVKEWETVEDLLKYANSRQELKVQAMLTRERINKGRHREGQLRQYMSIYHQLVKTKEQLNSMLMHHLDLYKESKVPKNREGYMVLTSFCDILAPWIFTMCEEHSWQYEFNDFDAESIVRIIQVVTECCHEIKPMLEKGTVGLFSEMLVRNLIEIIFVATGIIMKLYKRNRSIPGTIKTEKTLAKEMLKEVVSKVGDVVSTPINFRKPVQHIIFTKHFPSVWVFFEHESFKDVDIRKELIECINDIDATDNEGNTLVLLVAKQIQFDCRDPYDHNLLNILDFLIEKGAYLYARNGEGKTVIDYLTDAEEITGSYDENLKRTLDMLKKKVPSLQTLAAIIAKDIDTVGHIPEHIKRFTDMH